MHPIERLRYVARAGMHGPTMLAAEAAWALAELAERESSALVPASRRLLARQPGCGPLWWLCARVLCATDPVLEAELCAEELEDDPTSETAVHSLPEGARAVRRGGVSDVASADIVVIETSAFGPDGMVVERTAADLVECARAVGVPVWAEAGVGRVMPPRLWDSLVGRLGSEATDERATRSGLNDLSRSEPYSSSRFSDIRGATRGNLLGHEGLERVVRPNRCMTPAEAIDSADCPEPTALLEHF